MDGDSNLKIRITPPRGPVTGFILTWDQKNILDSTPRKESRRIRFAHIYAVTLDHGYLTLIDLHQENRKIVLCGEAAIVAWEWWNVWMNQNSMEGAP